MLELNLDKAKALVAEAIAERGEDYSYPKQGGSCLYVHDVDRRWDDPRGDYTVSYDNATPGCLVGLALHKGGISLEDMAKRGRNEVNAEEVLNNLQGAGLLTFTDEAMYYLSNAQSSQDNGAPWGQAAEAANDLNELEKVYDYDEGTVTFTGKYRPTPGMGHESEDGDN